MPKDSEQNTQSSKITNSLVLIFPNQLYHPTHPKHIYKQVQTTHDRLITCLVEDRLFFGHPKYTKNFHKQKLLLHRASMQNYFYELKKKFFSDQASDEKKIKNGTVIQTITNSTLLYLEHTPAQALKKSVLAALYELTNPANNKKNELKISEVHIYDPIDFLLEKSIRDCCNQLSARLIIHENPGFLLKSADITSLFGNEKKFYFTKFYINQRKKFTILLTETGSALGGRWSFDTQNRKKLPKNHSVPAIQPPKRVEYTTQLINAAQMYVKNRGIGHTTEHFLYPITHQEAHEWLDDFLQNRLQNFGKYEDAINSNEHFLYHSIITPSLNIGLITPEEVVQKTLGYAEKKRGTEQEVPLNSLEGFIRQIIGWREYMRALYQLIGVKQKNANIFNHKRKLKQSWYTGTTGLKPVDDVIAKLNTTAYAHHIERLMIIGNCMLLCEIDPNDVYTWFMEFFIDSYDWVMVPNVYGMSQYSDGGTIVTKPYISSSNYILKMSNYTQEPWCEIWDGLYWRFIAKNAKQIKNNPRMGMMTAQLEKMDPTKKELLFANAEIFLNTHTY